jgi:hypothetical protein
MVKAKSPSPLLYAARNGAITGGVPPSRLAPDLEMCTLWMSFTMNPHQPKESAAGETKEAKRKTDTGDIDGEY